MLNVGLSAGIINQRLFSMFVIVALVLTFITTPFTVWIYPARHREGYTGPKAVVNDREAATQRVDADSRPQTFRFLVVLRKIEHLSAVMFLTQMLEPAQKSTSEDESLKAVSSNLAPAPPVHIDALKLMELTGRTYSVMQSAEKDQLLLTDDTLQLYRQFGRLRGLDITPHISVVEADSFPSSVADYAGGLESELVIVPWTIPVVGSSTALIDPTTSHEKETGALSTFDAIFGSDSTGPMYSHFLRRVFSESPADLALFVDRGFGSSAAPGGGQHVFLPFFGGPDDRLALRLVVQLCQHANVTATVVRVAKADEETVSEAASSNKAEMSENERAHQEALRSNQLTLGPASGGYPGTEHRVASETADDLAWAYYTSPNVQPPRPIHVDHALARVTFYTQKTPNPLAHAYATAESSAQGRVNQWRPMLIVLGRGRRGAAVHLGEEVTRWLSERSLNPSIGAELRKTVGDSATALILGGGAPSSASFLILESKL